MDITKAYILVGIIFYLLSFISWILFKSNKRDLKLLDFIGGLLGGILFWPIIVIFLQQELWESRERRIKNAKH